MWLNILLNIVIPTLILTKGSKAEYLGPTWGLIVALAFPISYGVYEYVRVQKLNFFSALGVVSVLLTGGISLMKLPPQYMAVKEATIPALLGLAVLGSLYTRYPLVRTLLFNDSLMQVEKIRAALIARDTERAFEGALRRVSYLLAGSFFLSATLNYVLAKWILKSPPGSEAYNAELGKMTALSFPVITLPSMLVMMMALFYLFRAIKHLTGYSFEDVMAETGR